MKKKNNELLNFITSPHHKKDKQNMINLNISHSRYNTYSKCFAGKTMRMCFSNNFNVGVINQICNVTVVHRHAFDVLSDISNKGFSATLNKGINPACVCVVGNEFDGSRLQNSENIRDELVNLRSNFNVIVADRDHCFPLKETDCAYNQSLTIIRDNLLVALRPETDIYRCGLITSAPLYKPRLIDDSRMAYDDFLKMFTTVENIFQTAIKTNHNFLILPPFGHTDDEVPQEDIIKIYNSCIFKYGHKFKFIVIAISPIDKKELFELFDSSIVKPQLLVKEIDEKFVKKEEELGMIKKPEEPPKQQIDINSLSPEVLEYLQHQLQKLKK